MNLLFQIYCERCGNTILDFSGRGDCIHRISDLAEQFSAEFNEHGVLNCDDCKEELEEIPSESEFQNDQLMIAKGFK